MQSASIIQCRSLLMLRQTLRPAIRPHHGPKLSSFARKSIPQNPTLYHSRLLLSTASINTTTINGSSDNNNNNKQQHTTGTNTLDTSTSKFAAVHHGNEYETAWQGLHGQQLALAQLAGVGRDDPNFDPFIEDEQYEAQLAAMGIETSNIMQNDNNSSSSSSSSTIIDATFTENKITTNENNLVTKEKGYQNADIDDSDEEDGDIDDDDDVDDDSVFGSIYNNDGSLRRKKSDLAILRAGAPAGGLFAVIELAGSQHKVTTDDLLIVNRIKPVNTYKVGSIHTLSDVLLVGSSHLTCVGMPYVAGAKVDVMVEEITKDAKVIIFKKRRRKNSQRKNGFRRDVTMLRVLDIRLPEPFDEHLHQERPMPELLNEYSD